MCDDIRNAQLNLSDGIYLILIFSLNGILIRLTDIADFRLLAHSSSESRMAKTIGNVVVLLFSLKKYFIFFEKGGPGPASFAVLLVASTTNTVDQRLIDRFLSARDAHNI